MIGKRVTHSTKVSVEDGSQIGRGPVRERQNPISTGKQARSKASTINIDHRRHVPCSHTSAVGPLQSTVFSLSSPPAASATLIRNRDSPTSGCTHVSCPPHALSIPSQRVGTVLTGVRTCTGSTQRANWYDSKEVKQAADPSAEVAEVQQVSGCSDKRVRG